MSKGIKYSLFGFVGILVTAFLVVTLSLDYLVKSEIESMGTEMTQTSVTVDNVSVSPFSGSGTIEGLKVKNPDGFESEYAIVIQNFDISIDLGSILTDTLVINEILIGEPDFSVIQKVPENNLRMLMNNMNESMGESSSSSSSMIIEQLLIENGRVTVTPNIGGKRSATVEMGTVELQGIGREGTIATKDVVRQVASKLINEALNAALSGQLDGLKDKAKDAVKDIFN